MENRKNDFKTCIFIILLLYAKKAKMEEICKTREKYAEKLRKQKNENHFMKKRLESISDIEELENLPNNYEKILYEINNDLLEKSIKDVFFLYKMY